MPNREKVIHNLYAIRNYCKSRKNKDDPEHEMFMDWEEIIDDSIALLKDQETEKVSNEYKPYNPDGDAIDWATIHKMYTPKEIEDMVTLTEEQQKQIDELKHRIHAKEFYEMNYAIMSDMEPRKKFCD